MSHSLSNARARLAVVLAAFAVLTGLAVVSGPATPAAGAPASKDTSALLFAEPIAVTSSTGVKLTIGVGAQRLSFASFSSTGIDISLERGSSEDHDWSFESLAASTFVASARTGTGSVTTGTQLGSFGRVSLTISSAGAVKTTSCGGVTTTDHPVRVKGVIDFNTKSTGARKWGAVGGATTSFSFRRADISASSGADNARGCATPGCPSVGVSYDGFNGADLEAAQISGQPQRKHALIVVSRSVALNRAGSFDREDSVVGLTKKLTPRRTAKGESLAITTTTAAVTGSAVLTQAKKPTVSTCKKTRTTEYSAVLTAKKLRAHEQVFGTITVASSRHGSDFSVTARRT